MKVHLFIGSVYPTIHGAAYVSKSLIEGFNNNSNIRIKLLNTSYNNNINTIEKFSYIKILKLFYYLLQLIWVLSTTKIDKIIYIHSFVWNSFLKDSLFLKICLWFNKDIILYANGIGFNSLFYDKLSAQKQKYIDGIFQKVYKIIVVADEMISEYSNWVSKDKIIKIYNVCEPIMRQDQERFYNSNDIKILFISYIGEAKGIFDLLYAFNSLIKNNINVKLIVCGSFRKDRPEDEKMFFDYLEKNNLFQFVDLRGQVSGKDKVKAFLDADIFVLPTLRESFGIVNIEAMSAGLPVISTYQGAIPEYIENGINGYLYSPGDRNSLISLLEKLINNKEERLLMGMNNRKKFFELFDFKIFLNNWEKILI